MNQIDFYYRPSSTDDLYLNFDVNREKDKQKPTEKGDTDKKPVVQNPEVHLPTTTVVEVASDEMGDVMKSTRNRFSGV